jgi:uncharacterized protein (TIGR03000 family)
MVTTRVLLLMGGLLVFPAPHRALSVLIDQTPASAPASAQLSSTLTVMVPDENAELTVDGVAVPGTGAARKYETPLLQRGTTYSYIVSVTWQPNTYTTMTRSKTVTFAAGESVEVDLTASDPTDRVRVMFVPTPADVADEMVGLAGVTGSDVVFEPGCGDARITMAAVRGGARRGVCIDIDPDLVADARAKVKEAGLDDRIEVRLGDALEIPDLSTATVVFLYMGDHFNLLIRPTLWKELRVGARVVSHRFKMGDWEPEKTTSVSVDGADYELHRWTVTEELKRRILVPPPR